MRLLSGKKKYNTIISLVIGSLSYGSFELLGAFTPLRLIGFFAIPYLIRHCHWFVRYTFIKNWTILILFWWLFMLVSLLWTNNTILGITYFVHMTLMFSCILLLVRSCTLAQDPLKAISDGWLLFLSICLPIALWEISTGNHLSSGSFNAGSVMYDGSARIFAAVTFANLNSFVFMLGLCIPFLSIQVLNGRVERFYRILCLIGIVASSLIMLLNGSRVGLVCVVLECFLMFLIYYRRSNSIVRIVIISVVMFLVCLLINHIDEIQILAQIESRLSGRGSFFEDNNREQIISGAVDIIIILYGLGGGIMSMIGLFQRYTTCTITYAHNFYLEVIIEYGLVIGIWLFSMLYATILVFRKIKTNEFKFLFWYTLVSSPFLFVLDDYYQSRSGVWIYMGLLIAIANLIQRRSNNGNYR